MSSLTLRVAIVARFGWWIGEARLGSAFSAKGEPTESEKCNGGR